MISRRRAVITLPLALATLLAPASQDGTCLAQARDSDAATALEIRQRVSRESWDDGGDLSRFVYLHASEVFPSAVVKRSGPVLPLPRELRPEIGEFVVGSEKHPGQTLRQFIAASELDAFIVVHKGSIVLEHQYADAGPPDRAR